MFYPFSIKVNKCSGSCNNINIPYTKLCVPDTVKDINVKVFNLMSWSNQTKNIEWHKTCKCKYRSNGMKINVGVNVENYVLKKDVIKDLFGILVIVIVNVINHVMLENI